MKICGFCINCELDTHVGTLYICRSTDVSTIYVLPAKLENRVYLDIDIPVLCRSRNRHRNRQI